MNGAATPTPSWVGTITLAPLAAVFAGQGGDTPEHRHLAHKIVIGANAAGPSGRLRAGGDAIAVPAGAPHRVLAAQREVVFVYLDARRFRWSEAAHLAECWRRVSPGCSVDSLLADLDAVPAWTADERALAAVESMAQGRMLGDVSRRIGLSESRMTHLVTEQLGAPPRAWRTWIRLCNAVDLIGDGGTVTGAAHAAGFADSAHLSRTCSTALGIPPSALRKCAIERTRVGRCTFGEFPGSWKE